ncbi:MAG: hypothetical protein DIZ80_10710 [endosymbiont of Galathealinum brachiosum]|uniref:HPt domain-containing protein n=1 Tax=endosymbiont of Galathealinum brachiosum TaxID=2200906 RepID=A0A370DCU5_9GAMM|nr:MAG: hypothetical protein DIZ80_10710 [endosymbiont of Galathealinum brachiosum]
MTDAVIDTLVFNEIADLMGDSINEFIEIYLDNSPKLLKGIGIAVPAGDLEGVIANSHQLKGGSGSIGAMQVFHYAKQLEDDARAGESADLASVFVQLETAYEQVEADLRNRL